MKRAVTLLLSFAVFASGSTAPASGERRAGNRPADESTDPRTERERVRRQKAAAAAELDALESDADDIEKGLTDLADYVDYQSTVLDDAKVAQVEAGRQVVLAQGRVDAMAARIAELDAAVKQAALRAFTSSGSSGNVVGALVTGNPADAMQEDVLYGLVAGDVAGALDELSAAHADLRAAKRRADAAVARADEHRVKVESKIVDLNDAIDKQEELAAKVDDRIDQTLSEAANLESLDAKLSKEITEREAKLAAKVKAARKAKADRDAANGNGSGNGSGTGSDDSDSDSDGSGNDGSGDSSGDGGSSGGGSSGGSGSNDSGSGSGSNDNVDVPEIPKPVNGLVRINGITVDASLGPAIAQMVAWAEADGIRLTGGGFRSAEAQIAVRRANCGPSNYDIWQKPSSQCNPPAARPGKSMHEKGLAVDFACNGELVSNYNHWCYDKLASWARRVGLKNRGVEAWHWSTNGN